MKDPKGKMMNRLLFFLHFFLLYTQLQGQRVPVLKQIDLPHNYYFRELYIPQLTGGPSSVSWMPDGQSLVFSMGGSLWKQGPGTELAEQLTDGDGYDYQPDVSPDGKGIIFVRYNGFSEELMFLDLESERSSALTDNKGVNLEPRWSPDGRSVAFVSTANSGHFLLYKAKVENSVLLELECLTADQKSTTKRYYYSAFDHAINPVWSRDGKEIFFVQNHETAHGTGDIVSLNLESRGPARLIHHEETSWRTRPEISPDGTRMVYSSYAGSNWHQLWLLPTKGGYPVPLTYGDYDNTAARWSPDGRSIAFISNRDGNTSLWIVNAFDGGQRPVITRDLRFLQPHANLTLIVQDEDGARISSRISVTDSREKFYAPRDAWIHADDSRNSDRGKFEPHYFHSRGSSSLSVPQDKLLIQVSHGPEYEIVAMEVDARQDISNPLVVKLKKLPLPPDFGTWWSADLHVHMNYAGQYLNTPATLIGQAKSEDLNFVYNLIVNKEQRIPDVKYFSPDPDPASTAETSLLHGQEFHTSFWGHLGLLNLERHLIIPDYSGYPQTAVESHFPNNSFISDRAHEQNALVGYVHPYEIPDIFPDLSPTMTHSFPVDAALGKVDYFELMGFSDHLATEHVWYKLLNCGLRIPAAAGTDAMANYASLRGPVGLNRVYVKGEGPVNHRTLLKSIKEGKSFVTNGPIIGLKVEKAIPGDSIFIDPKGQSVTYSAFLRSALPVDHVEVIWNGKVIARHVPTGTRKSMDVTGRMKIKGPGWIVLHAWSDKANPDLLDIYPYASTNPIFIGGSKKELRSKSAGAYFLKWLDRIEAAALALTTYRSEAEKATVLADIRKARRHYENCVTASTVE